MPLVPAPNVSPISPSRPIHKRPRLREPPESKRPRACGGFLIEDGSDEEDDLISEEPPCKRRILLPSIETEIPNSEENMPNNPAEDILSYLMNQREKTVIDLEASPPSEGFSAPRLLTPTSTEFPNRNEGKFIANAITCSGKRVPVRARKQIITVPIEKLLEARSTTKAGRAQKSYYGIRIYDLINEAKNETEEDKLRNKSEVVLPSVECPETRLNHGKCLMWTDKYRASHFLELVGDDRTHRQVLRWLKTWDPIVFPKYGKTSSVTTREADHKDKKPHRKALLLAGPPGLGKTTLAHVCARQAGYEVMEINASDERSRDIVNGRIKTSLNTENVRTGSTLTSGSGSGSAPKGARPLCIIVDEVDGVVGSSANSDDKGFMNALIELINLDQKNTATHGTSTDSSKRKKKKVDCFKFQRPLIMICNDVYNPSLRKLRQSNHAEIIHVGKPALGVVVMRMKAIFEKEGVACDEDAVRRLCEATWGVAAGSWRRSEATAEGDLRSVLVVGEWAAQKLKSSSPSGQVRLTRKWIEDNMISNLSHGGGGARNVGRGEAREVVKRVFLEGAGFPKVALPNSTSISGSVPKISLGVAELAKRAGMERLREMVETLGDTNRVMTDIFYQYPNQPFNDDSFLSKPNAAYEWLHFHDACSSRIFSDQAFEMAPYLSQPVLACHHLFASPARHNFADGEKKNWGEEGTNKPLPFTGPRADYEAHEAEKSNRATILALQSSLNAKNLRNFKNSDLISMEILPCLVRMLSPAINPVVISNNGRTIASVRREREKTMVKRTVDIMSDLCIVFELGKQPGDFGDLTTFVYRMEPPLDRLVSFETANPSPGASAPTRYAIRQVLDQEYQSTIVLRQNALKYGRVHARMPIENAASSLKDKSTNRAHAPRQIKFVGKDFFGRSITRETPLTGESSKKDQNSWVTYHEGFSNAVRKPLTIDDLLRGL